MGDYEHQKISGTTVFRSRSVKEAMAEARMAFGADASVVSVEKVGGKYCVEVAPPQAEADRESQRSIATAGLYPTSRGIVSPPARALSVEPGRIRPRPAAVDSGFPLAPPFSPRDFAAEEVDGLESRFRDLASRIDATRPNQADGLVGMASIRTSLEACGFAEPFLGKLAGAMIDAGAISYTKELPMRIIASWMDQLGAASDMDRGWHAVVGPAGSGKTTSIAKLASRAVARLGPSAVGLVTTDFFRIGAYEQLRVFGELLGVKVHAARSFQELRGLRGSLEGKTVVFVDTVGSSRDDDKMREQMSMFAPLDIQSTVALQACLSRSVMRLDLGRWRDAGANSALVTKMDQAVGVASLVEALIMRRLPVRYATTGQRVPADLHKVSSLLLAHKAMRGEVAE